jgi:hypothetical protein
VSHTSASSGSTGVNISIRRQAVAALGALVNLLTDPEPAIMMASKGAQTNPQVQQLQGAASVGQPGSPQAGAPGAFNNSINLCGRADRGWVPNPSCNGDGDDAAAWIRAHHSSPWPVTASGCECRHCQHCCTRLHCCFLHV